MALLSGLGITSDIKSTETNNENGISATLEAVFLWICVGTVLSHVHLQLIRLFAGVVALLAGKRFLTGV